MLKNVTVVISIQLLYYAFICHFPIGDYISGTSWYNAYYFLRKNISYAMRQAHIAGYAHILGSKCGAAKAVYIKRIVYAGPINGECKTIRFVRRHFEKILEPALKCVEQP